MENCFTSSAEVFSWLSKHINLERGQRPKSFRLERMEVLTELAGYPHRCAPSIHIAGSKGKGSVTSMLTAMLTAAGFRAARYMSPHVTDIRERICLGDSFFSEDIYCSAGDELRNIAESPLPMMFDECEPTFWELLTLLFFLCARKAKCDVMVVETGMGGRLDSTNVVDPKVSVITLIELEHTNFLGNTITEIAGEKAGIIKQGKPLVLAKQNDEALEVFKNKAKEKNSPLYYFPEIAELSDIKITPQGTEFSLHSLRETPCTPWLNSYSLSIPISGKVQAENAALAIAALKIAFQNDFQETSHRGTETQRTQREISEEVIQNGLASIKMPARFENIAEANQTPFIIDGAHTPESLTLCIETFCSLYGEGGVLIFGCAADKDAAAMAHITHTHFSKIIITTPGTFKTSDPAQVYEAFAAIAGKEKTVLVPDTNEAVKQANLFAKSSRRDSGTQSTQREGDGINLPILCTGSFYLASEIRKLSK
ncbi:MAG: Mur ligase family protein [Treponema sp.]|nr:Mur ligase family protein [Treponema sp.]